MDNKRKATTSAGGVTNEADERAAKRQKLAEKYDLSKRETVESTTEHGLFFLEQIRRTQDKNGRRVAGHFEKLPSKDTNPDYYKKTRMPISLSMIERKLRKGDFATLTELESFLKRMVSNAKEFYPRNTQIFEDAERVRKALSNFMTKTNPAYSKGSYTATPTALPPDGVVFDEAEDEDEAEATPAKTGRRKSQGIARAAQDEAKTKEEDDEEEDAEAEEDNEEEEDEDDEEEQEDDAEGDEDDDEEASQTSKRAAIIIRRKSSGRPSKGSTPRKLKARTAIPSRPDSEYEGVPYKGLTFQTAQEKIVEEMLRRRDEGYQEPDFEAFVNLPSRSLKDYYRVIKEPLSIKKLQKSVKGVRGRNEATGTSEFKTWAAFQETASLLWENAFFYNEEGSEIYTQAQELKNFFLSQLKQAKAVVQEPSQPKIKLKVQQPVSEQPTTTKKITIHVGGKSDSAESPAPAAPQSATSQLAISEASEKPPATNGNVRQAAAAPAAAPATSAVPAAMEKIRSTPMASPSPSVANNVKREDATRPSPAVTPAQVVTPSALPPSALPPSALPPSASGQTVGLSSAQFQPIGVPPPNPQPSVNGAPPQPPKPVWDPRVRFPGKGSADALIRSLKVHTHPMINVDRRFEITLSPQEKVAQQSVVVSVPGNQLRIQIIPTLPPLEQEGRQHRLWVLINKHTLLPAAPVSGQLLLPGSRVFEAQLQAGVINTIEVHVVAALPRGQKSPSGEDFEVEQMTVLANVVRN
ncbi:Chromatin structure-remodeling complex subunit rsc1 [Colletotrichum trifolii]|uniref:Chromatin structure-remodeling complex subunit rsc1 n=1 Tax=Colletotrichum trifolii TaxID=5466 RepID=A0A4V6QEZ9_COLTR|nr:Chromatin structure-remodeling complex subunit rsc1 [Colletotrichum trifolii]